MRVPELDVVTTLIWACAQSDPTAGPVRAGSFAAVVGGAGAGSVDDAAAGGAGGGAFVDVNAVVDAIPAEFDCWMSQGRRTKATVPIKRMVAAMPPTITQVRRVTVVDLADGLAVDLGADSRGRGAA
jgi:hypothetical protein